MVALAFRFDLGRYHASRWGTHVNEAAVEWPPSPWRILRALYAAGRTNARLAAHQEQLDAALALLAQGPPPSYSLPACGSGPHAPLHAASRCEPDRSGQDEPDRRRFPRARPQRGTRGALGR